MKHTDVRAVISRGWLAFVRDHSPTVNEFIQRCGGTAGQVYHLLRKAGALLVEGDRVRLNPEHLSPCGEFFVWGNQFYRFDSDVVMIVCYGPRKESS